jgi:hypothetical protein
MKAAFTTLNPFNVSSPLDFVFNAPRPLCGSQVINNGEWLAGRFWAKIDIDEDFQTYYDNNVSLDATRVFTLTEAQMDDVVLASIPKKYIHMLDDMSEKRKTEVLKSYRNKLNIDLSNDKALALMLIAKIEVGKEVNV